MSKWTDEQAADAAIALLKPPHEITVMQSWFKPVPSAFGGHEAGPGRWVPVKEHADIVLTLGRRILDLEAELEQDEPLRAKMADLLTRTAIALKGEPDPLSSHSWHDLPEIAAAMALTGNPNCVNCDGMPVHRHRIIGVMRDQPCPACDALMELAAMRPVVERAYQWRDSDPNDRDYHPLVAAVDEHRAQREGK